MGLATHVNDAFGEGKVVVARAADDVCIATMGSATHENDKFSVASEVASQSGMSDDCYHGIAPCEVITLIMGSAIHLDDKFDVGESIVA